MQRSYCVTMMVIIVLFLISSNAFLNHCMISNKVLKFKSLNAKSFDGLLTTNGIINRKIYSSKEKEGGEILLKSVKIIKPLVISSLLAIGFLSNSFLLNPVFADDVDSIVMTTRVITVTSEKSKESTESPTKLKAIGVQSGSKSTVVDETEYSNLLKKEQSKQEAMKRSEVQRSRDMCESIGRGC